MIGGGNFIKAVWLVELGGGFGKKAIAGDADIATHPAADFGAEAVFDFETVVRAEKMKFSRNKNIISEVINNV